MYISGKYVLKLLNIKNVVVYYFIISNLSYSILFVINYDNNDYRILESLDFRFYIYLLKASFLTLLYFICLQKALKLTTVIKVSIT